MARTTPRVEGSTLVSGAGDAGTIAIGTPAWYAWLEQATTFAVATVGGTFTARKERIARAGGYWKAYRKRAGKVHSAYLGKSADLTLERLQAVAASLANAAVPRQAHERLVAGAPAPVAESMEHTALPTGTVTFLFTDIEGSSQLWEQYPQAMPAALARHDAIVRQAITAQRGVIFKTVGDGVYTVFTRAGDALSAALAAQRGLDAEGWGETGPLRVRMALHSGVAEQRDGDYFGSTLNRAARILALGHGGQVLLARATHDLVVDALPPQTTLRDLGEYTLKDLSRPEHLFQIIASNVPADFPPLRTQTTPPARSTPDAAPLLATKLYIPPLRPHLVPRPRLLERVQAGLMGKLTLIAAPAGFGKTTLVSAWRASPSGSTMPLAWVSLDADDNDAPRFWSYVLAALETVYPAMDTTAAALLRSPQLPPMDAIVTSLINAISPMAMEAALILDDYHLIATPAIHAAMTFLLDHLPPQLHLIMLMRADPPLPLTRLRARGELTELRAADLRFTAEEATAFLTVMMGLPLSSEEVAALEARTEGWVAGLQLAALAMRDRSDHAGFVAAFSGSNRFVVDYLVEEVLDRLPAHLQTFLLQTSILDRLCGPLCDALLLGDARGADPSAQAYSQVVLHELERTTLFLMPLDDERRWYRYHHLFAEVLRVRLRSGATEGEVARLHQRASMWHEREGLLGEAVRYAFLVDDVERAVALIEQHATAMLLGSSDVLLVRTWVERLPRSLIPTRPRLALLAGLTMVVTGQFDTVERLLADAAPAFSAPDLSPNIVGELAVLRSTIARGQGDGDGTLALARQALAQLALDNHGFRAAAALNIGVASLWRGELAVAKAALAEAAALGEAEGSQWIALGALEELASLQRRHGQLRQMLRTSEQAAQLSARLGERRIPAAGMGHVGIAEVLYEWNDLTGAMHAATQGTELLRGTAERSLLVRGYVALAQIHQAHGDHDGALDCIHRCEAWFAQTRMSAPGALAWLAAHQARLWVQQHNLPAAARWAQECAFVGDSELDYVQQLTLVRLRLAQSQNDSGGQLLGEASAMLAQLLPAVETRGWTRYLIEIRVLQALASQGQGDRQGALTALQRALTLAAPEDYVRVFVDEGVPIAALLAEVANRALLVAGYAARLLEAFPDELRIENAELRTTSSSNSQFSILNSQFLVEPLSDRELEILHLIAAGRSNQEVADTLVIAVSTVKKHINNLYGKLNVQSRTQALVRARELKLL
jgi:LuxR family transcriptional regulator, maltose regulon positive regulatory protein